MEKKLELIKRQLGYFTPTNDWQPQKYSSFLVKLEIIISHLIDIKNELKAGKNRSNKSGLIREASLLLEKFTTLKEKYY